MSGWYELQQAAPDLVVRPLSQPIPVEGNYSLFASSLGSTLETLARELRALYAERVVLELDVPDRMIRIDGLPRADAKPTTPGVAISFGSPHGPLRYASGEFATWQDNLRAIALALEALRKVDRYGVSKRGEQYRGWRELPVGTDPADAIQTEGQALAALARAAGIEPGEGRTKLSGDINSLVRAAIRATHPDHGGDPTEFRKVMRAKEVLAA